MMNVQYAQFEIAKDELVASNIFEDDTLTKVKPDVVDTLQKANINHVVTKCCSDDEDCEDKMDVVPFMTNCKTAGFYIMRECWHFIQGFNSYTGKSVPTEIQDSNYYIIYLDSSKFFPPFDYSIDCLDFTIIHLQQQGQQPKVGLPASSNQGGTTGVITKQSDINRLASVLDKKYQDSHHLKQETLAS